MLFGQKEDTEGKNTFHIHYKQELANLRDLVTRLSSKIEMLEAREVAQKELREITNQKFDKINEQIGEVREMFKILSSEKKEMEVKISETIELVKTISPQAINRQIVQLTRAQSMSDGKISLLTKQHDTFKKDFDGFSHKLRVFKGEDELIKLQTRVKEDLDEVHKLSHAVSAHASKFENNFIKIGEKATAISTAMSEFKAVKDSLLELQIDINKQLATLKEAADPTTQITGVQAKVSEIEESLNNLTDLTVETFESVKKKIAASSHNTVDAAEFDKMKRWVLHLIKKVK